MAPSEAAARYAWLMLLELELERLRSEGWATPTEGLVGAGVRMPHGGKGTPTVVRRAPSRTDRYKATRWRIPSR